VTGENGGPVPGVLYLVATPIGNMEDITLRGIDVLREVDVVAAEDTRHTRILFRRHDIETPLTSYHEHNERAKAAQLLRKLEKGESIAVVSDAGTPGISDPAYRLVSQAVNGGVSVVPIPGASSVLAALTISGLPTDRFVFEGFLPWKKGGRTRRLTELAAEKRTVVFFESPHRILRLLAELEDLWGPRQVAVARELTKRFEEVIRGTAGSVRARLEERGKPRGEFVVVVEGLRRSKGGSKGTATRPR
jgi:16S rRNA (cytidine1402-2'-O)-methyltransferase